MYFDIYFDLYLIINIEYNNRKKILFQNNYNNYYILIL